MEIILYQNVPNLGKIGEVLKVKDGYARNFLIPRKIAFPATQQNVNRIEQEKRRRLAAYDQEMKAAQTKADEMSKVSCTINVEVNDLEKLYGAISAADVIKALDSEGHKFDRKDVVFEKQIEELGIFEVGIKLHPEVTAKIRVWVTKK